MVESLTNRTKHQLRAKKSKKKSDVDFDPVNAEFDSVIKSEGNDGRLYMAKLNGVVVAGAADSFKEFQENAQAIADFLEANTTSVMINGKAALVFNENSTPPSDVVYRRLLTEEECKNLTESIKKLERETAGGKL